VEQGFSGSLLHPRLLCLWKQDPVYCLLCAIFPGVLSAHSFGYALFISSTPFTLSKRTAVLRLVSDKDGNEELDSDEQFLRAFSHSSANIMYIPYKT